jgi:hypothetical protein
LARIDALLDENEKRADFLRDAVERELARRSEIREAVDREIKRRGAAPAGRGRPGK